MAQICPLTGKTNNRKANSVSEANNKTRKVQRVNLREKTIFVPELGKKVRIRMSTRAMRTLGKKPLADVLKDAGLTLADLA